MMNEITFPVILDWYTVVNDRDALQKNSNIANWVKFYKECSMSDVLKSFGYTVEALNYINKMVANKPSDFLKIRSYIDSLNVMLQVFNVINKVENATVKIDERVIVEVNNLINDTPVSILDLDPRQFHNFFVSVFRKIYNSEFSKGLAYSIIAEIVKNAFFIAIGLASSATSITDNSVKTKNNYYGNVSIHNEVPKRISIDVKELRMTASSKSTLLRTIPCRTEILVIKEYRKWMVVSFVDSIGIWHTGYTTKDGLE